MKHPVKSVLFFGVAMLCLSCSSPKYIYNSSSANRQKELKNERGGNVFLGILNGSISIFSSAIFDSEIELIPEEQQFKKLSLKNPTRDTVYVNMLTDIYWDKNNYCDFMDIRIPPGKKCRLLVPVNANYNIYFSNTPQNDDDEMMQVNTKDVRKINLNPELIRNIKTVE